MTIIFESYDSNTGAFTQKRHPRGRLSDRAGSLFLQHRQPRGTMEATATTHLSMSAKWPKRYGRLSGAGANVFLQHRQPYGVLSDSTPVPAATVFIGSYPGHRSLIHTIITTHIDMVQHRQPRGFLADSTARFMQKRIPRGLLSDGHVTMDRTAFLVQQPELYATAFEGMLATLYSQYTGHATPAADFIHALRDLMRARDSYVLVATALQSLLDKTTTRDLAELIYFAGLVDSFIASAVIADTAQLTVLLKDTMLSSDAPTSISEILALLSDSLYATLTLNTGDDVYTAWVMTPQTKAMRGYTNFPFNSFAQMDNLILAAGPQGVYRLGGKTDISDVITARIRSGLTDMGARQFKRIDRAYLGYRSDGTLCLRVTATTQTGDKTVYTYQMVKQPADAIRESRVQVGRGVKSVYWSFELCNDGTGSNFELDNMTILPMVLTGKVL